MDKHVREIIQSGNSVQEAMKKQAILQEENTPNGGKSNNEGTRGVSKMIDNLEKGDIISKETYNLVIKQKISLRGEQIPLFSNIIARFRIFESPNSRKGP